MRYANPFRFYLTISVLFFLIIGATESYDKFEEYRKGKVKTDATPSINSQIDIAASTLDPNSPNFNTNINEALKKIDSTDRKELLKITPSVKLDSIKKDTITNKNQNVISFLPNWSKFSKFQRKYPKVEIEDALESLSVEHTFFNRFLYSRVKAAYEIGDNDNDKLTQLKKAIYFLCFYFSLCFLTAIYIVFKIILCQKKIYIRRTFSICFSYTNGLFSTFDNLLPSLLF